MKDLKEITSAVLLQQQDFKSKWIARFNDTVSKVGPLCLVRTGNGMRYIVSGYDNKKPTLESCGIAYGLHEGHLNKDYIYKNEQSVCEYCEKASCDCSGHENGI